MKKTTLFLEQPYKYEYNENIKIEIQSSKPEDRSH